MTILKAHPVISVKLVASSLFINILALSSSIFVINVLNRYVTHGVNSTLYTLAAGTLMWVIFEWLFRAARRRLIIQIAANEEKVNSEKAFGALLSVKHSVLSQIPPGLQQETVRNVDQILDAFSTTSVASVLDAPFALVFIAAIALLSPPLALLASGIIILGLMASWIYQKLSDERQQKLSHAYAIRAGLMSSGVKDAETLRSFNLKKLFAEKWQLIIDGVLKERGKLDALRDSNQALISLLQGVMTVSVISLGATLVVSGDLSVGALIGANILASRSLSPLMRLVRFADTYSKAKLAKKRLNDFAALAMEGGKGVELQNYSGSLSLEDIALAYKGQRVPLFESLSLSLLPGQKLIVTGPNGAGKTSFARLLIGLVESSRGQLKVGDVDLRQLNLTWWREQLMYIPQEPSFIPGTIFENLQSVKSDIEIKKLNQAILLSGLRKWIDGLADGLNTRLSDSDSLPLGIKKRFSLARALLMDGPLVIADEPLEGLDDEGKQLFLQVISQLHEAGKTLIICSNDPLLFKGANFQLDLSAKPKPQLRSVPHAA